MAALDFPSSPINGQTYTSGTVTWSYSSTKGAWIVLATGISGYTGSKGDIGYTGSKNVTYTGSTPPVSAIEGDTWWDPETASRYVYYTDVDTSQWVQDSAVGAQGPIGYTGSLGYTGSASTVVGYTGSIGYTGSEGAGYTGSIGYTGSAGAGYTGSQGGFTASTLVTSASYSASPGQVIAANTFTNPISVSLPGSPVVGAPAIVIYDAGSNSSFNGFATNNLTVLRNGSTIHDVPDDVIFTTKSITVIFEYIGTTWRIRNGS